MSFVALTCISLSGQIRSDKNEVLMGVVKAMLLNKTEQIGEDI